MKLKENLKRLVGRLIFGACVDGKSYLNYLRNIGVKIGERTTFVDPRSTLIDTTRPWLVSIGSGCTITGGVTILTHDYSLPVIREVYGEVVASGAGKVSVGDNVYIGMHTTIVAGVTIGNNVIIGANSLVCKDIPDNCVAAGNPARVLYTLQEYYTKRKACVLQEAKELACTYMDTYRQIPPKELFYEHFWLFSNTEQEMLPEYKKMMGQNMSVFENYLKHEKMFDSYEDFIAYCRPL